MNQQQQRPPGSPNSDDEAMEDRFVGKKRPAREIGVPSTNHVSRQLLSDLSTALTTKQRLLVLQKIHATLQLGHDVVSTNVRTAAQNDNINKHPAMATRPSQAQQHLDWFVQLGGVNHMWSQLGVVLDRPWVTTAPEVQQIARTILLLYRHTAVSRSVLLVVDATDDDDDDDDWPDHLRWLEQASHYKDTASDVTALVHWLSSCSTGTNRILCTPALMQRLIVWLGQWSSRPPPSSNSNLHELLGCFQNLTYFDQPGGRCWSAHPNFGKYLTQARGPRAAAVWRNLALKHTGRGRLATDVDMPDVLHALTVDNTSTLPHVLATAIHLSMHPHVSLTFLLYGDGLYLTLVEQCLQSTAHDATTRKRAARLVRLWTTHETSARIVVQQASSLMGTLSAVAVGDSHKDVRREAAEAFGRAAAWIQSPMPQHEVVLSALEQLVQSAAPAMVARTLQAQVAHPCNRHLVGHSSVLVDALVRIASDRYATSTDESGISSALARQEACRALQHLTTETDLCPTLLEISSHRLLDAVMLNLPAVPAAAQMVINILQCDQVDTAVLCHHEGLLPTLVRCAAAPGHPLHAELKRVVLKLVEAL